MWNHKVLDGTHLKEALCRDLYCMQRAPQKLVLIKTIWPQGDFKEPYTKEFYKVFKGIL